MNMLILLLAVTAVLAAAALLTGRVRGEKTGTKTRRSLWCFPVVIFPVVIGFLARYGAAWYNANYSSVGFDAVLYTLTGNLNGTDQNLVNSVLLYMASGLPWLIPTLALLLYHGGYALTGRGGRRIWPVSDKKAALLAAAVFLILLGEAAVRVEFPIFLLDRLTPSTLFEEEYWHPDDVAIEFPEKKRNLIYIFMESMETTFFSEEEGGCLEENMIPELYRMAQDNVNFSHRDGVGGFTVAPGTSWTIGAMIGHSAGIPLKMPLGVEENDYGEDGSVLPGVQSLGNILGEAGYKQAVMFGSWAFFGGRLQYYTSHGACDVYDLGSAWETGIVPDGYDNGFWGIDDQTLYRYAKQVLTEMAADDQPFAFTLLTVDTHFPDGYVCDLCQDTYPEQYDNVYRCASRQIAEFCSWLEEQDFYEDTTIVIVGDHLSMDGGYVARNVEDESVRKVYNCFINAAAEPIRDKNREMSTFDMFPTTLAAMGCTIEGERLGLGTNMFSDVPTLLETYGSERFTREVSRYSKFYENNFYQ